MTETHPDPLRLTRSDPDRNMARFYVLALEPTLFGEVSLVRNWGRIGTRGQIMMETFTRAQEASAALGQLERAKRKRGYCETAADPIVAKALATCRRAIFGCG